MSTNGGRHRFATTRWSLVRCAAQGSSATVAKALEELCAAYWEPLYWHVRRRGYRAAQAEDLTQTFFARLLEKGILEVADEERGRFRTFLLTALQRFLANEHQRETAQKRGGKLRKFSMDFDYAERIFSLRSAQDLTAEQLFEKRWAINVLEQALASLEVQQCAAGKRETFEALLPHLKADSDAACYADIADTLGMTQTAVKKAAERLRRDYGNAIRTEILQTVDDPREVDDEIRCLFRALRT